MIVNNMSKLMAKLKELEINRITRHLIRKKIERNGSFDSEK